MPQRARPDASKRSFRLNDEMMDKIERIAKLEGRTLTAQMERFLWEKIREYEKKSETTPGQPRAARLAA